MTSRWIVVLVACAACGKKPDVVTTGSGSAATAPPAIPVAAAVELPTLDEKAALGYVDADATLPRLVATLDEIRIDDKPIVVLAALGADARKNDKITAATAAIPKRDRLALALDPHTTYRTLFQIMTSAKQGDEGFKKFAVLATIGKRSVMVPIDLPDMRPAAGAYGKRVPGADLAAQVDAVRDGGKAVHVGSAGDSRGSGSAPKPVADDKVPAVGVLRGPGDDPYESDESPRLVVSIARDQISVWSIDGSEGTLQKPKAVIPLHLPDPLGSLARVLFEIGDRRWKAESSARPKSLLVMADSKIEMQMVANVFGVVHATKLDITLAFLE